MVWETRAATAAALGCFVVGMVHFSGAAHAVGQAEGPKPSQTIADNSWRPDILVSPALNYPSRAAALGVEGSCNVIFQVDRTGFGRNFDLECTDPIFESETIRVARQWRFTPYSGTETLSPRFKLSLM